MGWSNWPFPEPVVPHAVRNTPQPDVPGIVVVVVGPDTQMPLVLGFVCLQSVTRWWHVFRADACIFLQTLFSARVPVQLLLLGTLARQLVISCRQSLRQWPAFAATRPASIATRPTDVNAKAAKNRFSIIRADIVSRRLLHARSCRQAPDRELGAPQSLRKNRAG